MSNLQPAQRRCGNQTCRTAAGSANNLSCRHPCAQVYLDKPLGVRFSRGNDGGAYVVRSDAKIGSTDPSIEVRGKPWPFLALSQLHTRPSLPRPSRLSWGERRHKCMVCADLWRRLRLQTERHTTNTERDPHTDVPNQQERG